MPTPGPMPWIMPGMMQKPPQISEELKQKQQVLDELKSWNMKLNKLISKLMWIKEEIQKDVENLETDKLLQNM